MENEITTTKTGELVQTLDSRGLGELLKPLIREIHLFDTYVAGTTHLEDMTILDRISTGDKLDLRREANKFDDNAVLIITGSGEKLGYIPEKDNLVFSRLMDAGKMLSARISSIEKKGSFTKIGIGIYLVDF